MPFKSQALAEYRAKVGGENELEEMFSESLELTKKAIESTNEGE